MERLIAILNEMVSEGVVEKYAVGGATAVLMYAETINTKDVDVFVVTEITKSDSGIVHLGTVYDYLKRKGFKMQGQYFVIDGVPVDFIAAYDELSMEALDKAVLRSYGKAKVKVFSPEHIVAIALKTGRARDTVKIDSLLHAGVLNKKLLSGIIKRYGLAAKWKAYEAK